MILSAHQPAYLPWLGYFHKLYLADKFVILDDVQFEKNSFINRNKIRNKVEAFYLTIPLKMKNHLQTRISDMEVDSAQKWQAKHWKSIQLGYSKAPYYSQVCELLEPFYNESFGSIVELTSKMLLEFLKYLDLQREVILQSDLQTSQKKQDLIVEICEKTKASSFIFGKQGLEYADFNFFEKKGLDIHFQQYIHPIYSQSGETFIPNLSIVDLLMNVRKDNALKVILEKNVQKV